MRRRRHYWETGCNEELSRQFAGPVVTAAPAVRRSCTSSGVRGYEWTPTADRLDVPVRAFASSPALTSAGR